MHPRNLRASFSSRLASYGTWLACLLVVITGCNKSRRSVEHAEVTGQVIYKKNPVPGGEVTFVAVDGGWVSKGIIDKDGNYKISAPVGEVKITVENQMLTKMGTGKGTAHETGMKGAGKPRPDAPDTRVIEGKWIQLPAKYYKADTSDLTYTVKPGPQTFTIELKD
jgi:hypothetical protein